MSTYAVGDIQGCFDEFQALLKKCRFNPHKDKLWLVGDLINRGKKNIQTLDYLIELGDSVKLVLGNHDLHFLAMAKGNGKPSRSDTIQDLLEHQNCDLYVHWLRQHPLVYTDQTLDYVMVHAGLPPIWSISTCLERAREVETILSGDSYESFLSVMYGDEPSEWDDQLKGMDRIRLITNYFTRMRYCTRNARLELNHKTTDQPTGFSPWFTFRRPEQTQILFGHWAALDGVTNNENTHALDTGCVWGRRLTAMRLEDRKIFQCQSGES